MWALRRGRVSTYMEAASPPPGSSLAQSWCQCRGQLEWHIMQHFTLLSILLHAICHMTGTFPLILTSGVFCWPTVYTGKWGVPVFFDTGPMGEGMYTWSPPNVSDVYIKMSSPTPHYSSRDFTRFNILLCHLSLGIKLAIHMLLVLLLSVYCQ